MIGQGRLMTPAVVAFGGRGVSPPTLVLRLVNTVSYRADALRRFPSLCPGLAGGFLSATLATSDRSLPFRSTQFLPHSIGRSEEPPAAPGTGSYVRIRCRIYEA